MRLFESAQNRIGAEPSRSGQPSRQSAGTLSKASTRRAMFFFFRFWIAPHGQDEFSRARLLGPRNATP